MNERIRELAEQARQYAEEKQNDPLKIYTLDYFNEKFAELIVRECTKLVDEHDATGTGIIQGIILKHFGVDQ